ncbi:MAG: DUF6491 family protein [Steroidobacteraceae bacterium]
MLTLGLCLLPDAALAQAPASLQAYRIDDWRAISASEIVITANNGRRYRAQLASPCPGLRFTDRIAFVTRGERRIDRFAGIQLPDGTRCMFRKFAPQDPVPAGR